MEAEPSGSGIETTAAAAAAGTAKQAGDKKMKIVRVKQEYIDYLLARKPYPFVPEELIQHLSPKRQESLRATQAMIAASLKAAREEEEDILEQYRAKGYAETEVEDRDDEGGITMGN